MLKMKKVKDKEILVGADFAGFPLKEAVCEHLRSKGWKINRRLLLLYLQNQTGLDPAFSWREPRRR